MAVSNLKQQKRRLLGYLRREISDKRVIQAMERMYAEVMSIKDELKANMRNPALDATVNQELLMQARGAAYRPLPEKTAAGQ